MTQLKAVLSPLPMVAAVGSTLLGIAGAVAGVRVWPTAWAYIAVYGVLAMAGSLVLARLRPASFQVRQQGLVAKREKKQPLIDVLGLMLYGAFFFGWYAFIPLDVFRLHLLPQPGGLVQAAGLVTLIAGMAVVHVAIGQNQFAAPTIHDQSGEGQRVIETGLYGVVRHPFYAGMLLVYLGTALFLGSAAAAIGSAGFLLMTLARIPIEEGYLRANVAGYADYARRVRSRLIPYVL